GLLHGGASAALAETLGSVAGTLVLNSDDKFVVGVELNANHLRPMREGAVFGRVSPIHLGKTIQVWDIRIRNGQDKPVCISRLTLAVMNKKKD
ncbi:MAG: hotdog fold thioesterase, partial [Calditrichia bacterium]